MLQKIPKTIHAHHWRYIYLKRRRRALGISTKQMASSQVFSLVGSVIAGFLLESHKHELAMIVGAFVVLPGVFDFGGTLGAVLSAKINHRLEDPDQKTLPVFLGSLGFAFLIAFLGSFIVASVGAAISTLFFDASFGQVFWLAEGAIMLSALVGFPLIGGLSVFFRRLKINPDDVVGPIESSIFDILTVITMVVVIGWLA